MSEEKIDKETYEEIWKQVAKPEIERAITASSNAGKPVKLSKDELQLKDLVFKRIAALNKDGDTDRHKIAALFYIAITEKTDGFPFLAFNDNIQRKLDADILLSHTVAFNISIGIVESYILSNSNEPESFKDYLWQNGISHSPEQQKGNPVGNYERQTVKQLIHAYKENKLSVHLIANIFYKMEYNSKLVFLLKQR